MKEIPLLVIKTAKINPPGSDRVEAQVLLGGHSCRVVLDFSRRSLHLIEQVEVPQLVGVHPPTLRAIEEICDRFVRGERLKFPLDLSAKIAKISPPSPFAVVSDEEQKTLDRAANSIPIKTISCDIRSGEPCKVTASFQVSGRLVEVSLELWSGTGRIPVTRWLKDPGLNRFERYAIHRKLIEEGALCGRGLGFEDDKK